MPSRLKATLDRLGSGANAAKIDSRRDEKDPMKKNKKCTFLRSKRASLRDLLILANVKHRNDLPQMATGPTTHVDFGI